MNSSTPRKCDCFFRVYEDFVVHRVLVLEALQVKLFQRIFAEVGQFRYLLVGKPIGQKSPRELKQLTGDVVAVCFEGEHSPFPYGRSKDNDTAVSQS